MRISFANSLLGVLLSVVGVLLPLSSQAALTASVTLDAGAPTAIYPSQETRLSITLTNSSVAQVTNTGFSLTLPGTWPAGLRVSSAATYTCADSNGAVSTSGSLTAAVGTSTITLSGGVLPARANNVDGSCNFIVPVTAGSDSVSSYQVTIANGAVSGTESGGAVANVGTVSQTINVTSLTPYTVQESYSSSTVYQQDETTLTITVTNPNPVAVPNFSFTDTFNAAGHIVVAATPGATASCNNGGASPSFSPSAGAGALTLAGTIPAKSGATNGSCTFTVKVRAPGVNTSSAVVTSNTLSAGTNDLNLSSNRYTSNLTIYSALAVTESISATPAYPSYIYAGDAQSLTLTLTNRSSGLDLTNVGLSLVDHIRKGTSTGSPVARGLSFSNVSTTCGGTAGATGTTLTLTGASLAKNSSCTVTATYSIYADANSTASSSFYGVVPAGTVSTAEAVYSPASTTSHYLYVTTPLNMTQQWQGAASAGGTSSMVAGDAKTLTVTLRNYGSNVLAVSSFAKDPIDGLSNSPHPAYGLNVTGAATNCSGGSATPSAGGYGFTLAGGTIPAASGGNPGSCTVTLTFTGTTATGSGSTVYSNIISNGAVTTVDGLHYSSGVSSGNMTVNSPLQATVSYALTSAPGTGITTLTSGVSGRLKLTLSNVSSGSAMSAINLALDPLLRYSSSEAATGLNLTAIDASACTGASASLAGTTGISVSNVSLAAGASCTVNVDFTATPRVGNNSTNYYAQILSTGSASANAVLTGTLGGSVINGLGATDPATRLTVTDTIRVGKSQLPGYYTIPGYYTGAAPANPIKYLVDVDNYDSSSAQTNIVVTDALPNGITFLTGTINGHNFTPALSGSGCGGQTTPSTSNVTGDTTAAITIPNINIAPSGSFSRCTLTFWGMLPTNATLTTYNAINNNVLSAGSVCAGAVCNGGASTGLSARVASPLTGSISFYNYSYSGGTYSSSPYHSSSYGYYGYSGAPTRIRIDLSNITLNALTGVSVSGTLPTSTNPTGNQLRIAYPANFSTNCGTATGAPQANDSAISITGLTIPARADSGTNNSAGSCYLQFDVIGDAATYAPSFAVGNATGAYANSATPVTLADVSASNTYTYFPALSGSLSFNPTSLVTGRQTTATVTINASSSGPALIDNVALSNPFPTGITLAPAPNARTTCDGTVSITATPGASTIQMSGARLARGTSCQLIYDVQVNFPGAVGSYITDTVAAGELSGEGGTLLASAFPGYPSYATVWRAAAPSDNLLVAMSANPSSLTFPGQVSRLTITLTGGTSSITSLGLATYFTEDGTSTGAATGVVIAPNPQAATTCTGGSLSATAGSNSMVLSGASLASGASCTLAVNVLSNSVGGKTLTVPAGAVTTQQGVTNSNFASTSIAVGSNIGVLKAFSPRVVAVNERARLRITFYNPSNLPMSSLSVTDTLPSGLVVPAGASPTTTCTGATVSAPTTGTVQIADGTIAATPSGGNSASCYAEIDVVATSQGEYINTIPVAGVSAIVAGATAANSQAASDTLLVKLPLVARVGLHDTGSTYRTNDSGTLPTNWAAGVVSRLPGSYTTLKIRLENGNATSVSNVAFRLDLPSGLLLTSSPSVSNSCGGSVDAQANGTYVRLSAGALAAGGSCEINAYVVSNTPGQRFTPALAVGTVSTYEGVANAEPSGATLEVLQKPSVGVQFVPSVIAPGGTSRLTLTLNNPNSSAITLSNGYTFTNNLPAGVTIAATPNVQTTCAGTVTANAGATSASYLYYYYNPGFLYAPIQAGGCTISVDVTAGTAGSYLDYIAPEQLKTSAGNNLAAASATLDVNTLGYISGRVFKDNNTTPNGTFEIGTDTPMAGAEVALFIGGECGGPAQRSYTYTNALGVYTFNGLAAGIYSVCQMAQPAGTINGTATAGAITAVNGSTGTVGTASNLTSTTSQIVGIVLNDNGAGGETSGSSGNDFAELVPSSIAGTVFVDVNNNGVQNGADSGVNGNTINLLASDGTTVAATTTTNSAGAFLFSGLAPGTYYLEQPTQPAGTSNGLTIAGTVGNGGSAGTATAANVVPSRIGAIVLPPNVAATGFNFAEVPNTRTLYGWIFLDRNGDGLRNGTDSGLSSQTLNLTGNDVNGNAVSRTTTTASDGSYAFTSLPEGSAYTVTQPAQPASTTNGATTAGSTGGTATAIGVTPSAISGIDLSGMNTISAENNFAEIPVAAPDLTLAMAKSPTEFDVGTVVGTYTITPSNSGQDATSGAMTVTFTAPSGMTPSSASGTGWTCVISAPTATCTSTTVIAAGASGNPVSLAVDVAPASHGSVLTASANISGGNEPVSYNGNNSTTLAVTILGTSSVSGIMWRDTNRNQAFDAGEPKLQGWIARVYLGGSLVATSVTDINGAYSFSGLIPGNYQLRFFDASGAIVYGRPVSSGSVATTGDGTLRITLGAGDSFAGQNFPVPVDPSGIVYNAVTRSPVAGAVVTISGPAGFVPATHVVAGSATYTTVADGFYQFWLTPSAPAGTYTLAVTTYPVGYTAAASTLIPACTNTPTVLAAPSPALVHDTATVPPTSATVHNPATCPADSSAWTLADTTYYYSFSITPGTSADTLNNHIPIDPLANLTIVKSALTSLAVGLTTNYTVTVSNAPSGAPASGATVRESIPAGVVLESIGGGASGWACTEDGGGALTLPSSGAALVVRCVSATAIASGASATPIPVSITPQAGISGTTITLYSSVDPSGGSTPPAPGAGCAPAGACASNSGLVGGTDAFMTLSKTVSARNVELGDGVGYTLVLKHVSGGPQNAIVVRDTLPRGFKYIPNTIRIVVSGSRSETISGDAAAGVTGVGPLLNFSVGNLIAGDQAVLTYRVRVGVGALQGDGVNRARATSMFNVSSNEATATVKVTEGVFASTGCLVGKIYMDCNGNGIQDGEAESGIPGVRLYLEDGSYLISDAEGKYSLCDLSATTHVIKVDSITLPRGAVLSPSSNRNARVADSLFVDMKFGELHRADFLEGSCAPDVLDEVKVRREKAARALDGVPQAQWPAANGSPAVTPLPAPGQAGTDTLGKENRKEIRIRFNSRESGRDPCTSRQTSAADAAQCRAQQTPDADAAKGGAQ